MRWETFRFWDLVWGLTVLCIWDDNLHNQNDTCLPELPLLLNVPSSRKTIVAYYQYQSGTKPNLVAKIWLPTLVNICNGLPKLVAQISSHIHHLVNTGFVVGSLVKWLRIKVATPANQTQFGWFITRRLGMAPSDCAQRNFASNGVRHFTKLLGAHTLKN